MTNYYKYLMTLIIFWKRHFYLKIDIFNFERVDQSSNRRNVLKKQKYIGNYVLYK